MAKKPVLNFTDFTDEDLDELSIVTTFDIVATNNRIMDNVSRPFKNLILAVKQILFDNG